MVRYAAVMILAASIGHTATFDVNTTIDYADDGYMCPPAPAQFFICSLRAAIQRANRTRLGYWIGPATPAHVIKLGAGTYSLTLGGANEDVGAAGDLDVRTNLWIIGQGAASTVIDASSLAPGVDRVLDVLSHWATVNVVGVTIRGGRLLTTTSQDGGGIRNRGILTLTDCVVAGNHADTGRAGGGIANTGSLRLVRTLVAANTSQTHGGGISNGQKSDLVVVDSTVANNQASNMGGGIANAGSLMVSRSTISANRSRRGGGLRHSGSHLEIDNSTFSANIAEFNDGGAIYADYASSAQDTHHITSTTLKDNTYGGTVGTASSAIYLNAKGANIVLASSIIDEWARQSVPTTAPYALGCLGQGGAVISDGYNLETGSSCGLASYGDRIGVGDARLGGLSANGGPTATHALLAGSPAIDGIPLGCASCPATDQRGLPRPAQRGFDIGSFEAQ